MSFALPLYSSSLATDESVWAILLGEKAMFEYDTAYCPRSDASTSQGGQQGYRQSLRSGLKCTLCQLEEKTVQTQA